MAIRRLAWEWISLTGREDLVLHSGPVALCADGEIAGTFEGEAFRLVYRLECTPKWEFRAADLELAFGRERRLLLVRRGVDGGWQMDAEPRPDLARASAIDIMATKLTNTIPIRTLVFVPDVPTKVIVAYVPVPSLEIVPKEQEYTLISPGRFRYRNPESGFTAELQVDGDGLVERCGEIWCRS